MIPTSKKRLPVQLCGIGLLGTLLAVGACERPPPDSGIMVDCDSNTANSYWKAFHNHVGCESAYGPGVTSCYLPVHAENIQHCYEKDEWLAAGGETGEAADAEGIDRNNWPVHGPSLSYIRDKCSDKCEDLHNDNSRQPYVCNENNWVIHGFETNGYIDAEDLEDPGDLNCEPWYSTNNTSHVDPSDTNIITSGSPRWPSDGGYLVSSCGDFETCAGLFDVNVLGHLVRGSMSEPGSDESEADYLATSPPTSASRLLLKTDHPDGPSQESNWVGGRIEYTALACGAATCPFYLGNLTVTNTVDTWDLRSLVESDDIDVEHIVIQLRRPVLGLWRPSTGELYIGDEMLDLRVDFEVRIGAGSATSVTKYTTNQGTVWGSVSRGGAVELSDLSITDGDVAAEANLEFSAVNGAPPVASIALNSPYTLPHGTSYLQLSSITNNSSDPDSDLQYELWIVDGNQVASTHQIGAGAHTVRLEVWDSRFAFDFVEQAVVIQK